MSTDKFILTTNKGRRLVSKVHYTRRSQKYIGIDTTSDPGDALTFYKIEAEDIAKDSGATIEPYKNITRFYR